MSALEGIIIILHYCLPIFLTALVILAKSALRQSAKRAKSNYLYPVSEFE
jgi:hypothetical protein